MERLASEPTRFDATFTLYDVRRSVSWSGYNYISAVQGEPCFQIFQRESYSGRIVEYSSIPGQVNWVKMVELWSLNADGYTFPFFLGVKDQAFTPHIQPTLFHTLDGDLGPFNDTEHPQEYNATEPWLAFIQPHQELVEWVCVLLALIQKQDNVCTMDQSLVEDLLHRNFCLDLQLWHIKEKLCRHNNGTNTTTNFPMFPGHGEISLLINEASYPNMLDHIVAIQRGLRCKDTCITYHSLPLMPNSNSLAASFICVPIPEADMSFLGLWGNGLNEDQLAW